MTLQDIQTEVESALNLDLTKKNRERHLVYARAVYFKLSRELCPMQSLSNIGSSLGKDHSTVLHSIKKIFPTIKNYEQEFYAAYNSVKRGLLVRYGNGDFDSIEMSNKTTAFLGVQKQYENELSDLQKKYKDINEKYELLNLKNSSDEFAESLRFIRRVPMDKYSIFLDRLDAMTKMMSI
tara:strand:- start:14147 stop:14686 length:540 start_codon:yes stop_codon:yes gene_type:complete